MKRSFTLKLILAAIVISGSFVSCKKSGGGRGVSDGTGWKMDGRDGGFQANTKYKGQETGPGLVFVEGGSFTMGQVQDDVMHDWNNTPTQQTVQSFYIDEHEVTNVMYLEYLDWLKRTFPPENSEYRNIYYGALPDTLVWRSPLGSNEVFVENYLRHPAYQEYPVVGVSWVQAMQYANWRTDRVNEFILESKGLFQKNAHTQFSNGASNFNTDTYLASPENTYGGDSTAVKRGIPFYRYNRDNASDSTSTKNKSIRPEKATRAANTSDGLLLPKYTLPTEAQWEYAAKAIIENREYNNIKGRKKYPWNGMYTRRGDRKRAGDQLANFKQGRGDYSGIAGWSDDGATLTIEVKHYPPNAFGIYDMAGNVAEWVADVYRPIIDASASDLNYYRGNDFTKQKIGEDGKVVIIKEGVEYDTLSNGRIVPKVLPGSVARETLDEADVYLRPNFEKAYNVNYRDGDFPSTRFYEQYTSDSLEFEELKKKTNMYNSPQNKISRDSLGNIIRNRDKTKDRTSLVSDEVRVYKGGSWKDRAYWLDPAQRRYLPQDMATNYIGFRCAMPRVGSESLKKKRARD